MPAPILVHDCSSRRDASKIVEGEAAAPFGFGEDLLDHERVDVDKRELDQMDYNSPTVIKDLIEAFKAKTIAGAIAIGAASANGCLEVVHASKGNKFVSIATFPIDFRRIANGASVPGEMIRQSPKLVSFALTLLLKSRLRGIRSKAIYGTTLMDNEVSRIVYIDFLPKALAEKRFVAAPKPMIVGKGLAAIQSALDIQLKGVSAAKVVVSL